MDKEHCRGGCGARFQHTDPKAYGYVPENLEKEGHCSAKGVFGSSTMVVTNLGLFLRNNRWKLSRRGCLGAAVWLWLWISLILKRACPLSCCA